MTNAKKYNVEFHRVTNNGDDHYESMTLNYTIDKNPTFRSYNPFTGGFLAQPNTVPWIIGLSFGYAVLLNESENLCGYLILIKVKLCLHKDMLIRVVIERQRESMGAIIIKSYAWLIAL
uniref:Uncharacterized protein n=1 Tax=Romanomermis culicivorax TaxID=13658 RepID=A0A915J2Q2_ROMCU